MPFWFYYYVCGNIYKIFMETKKNKSHPDREIRRIRAHSPDKIILVAARAPAYLFSDASKFGDVSRIIQRSLELTHKERYKAKLREIIGDIQKQVALLQIWEESGGMSYEEEIDRAHLELMEVYRSVYFTLKETLVLRRRK
jgi:hypothetical protein